MFATRFVIGDVMLTSELLLPTERETKMASKWCLISWNDNDNGPDNTLPIPPSHIGGGPVYRPDYPTHALPGGGRISTLPVFPFDPTLSPDNELPAPPLHPSGQPIMPGTKLMVKWLCGFGLIGVPLPTPVPEPK